MHRRTLLAAPAILLGRPALAAPPPLIGYGTEPPPSLPNVLGRVSPLGWRVGFFDDFTRFEPSRYAETARTDATTLWETTMAPGTHHVNGAKEQQYYCNPHWTPGINPFSQRGSVLTITATVATPQQLAQLRRMPDYQKNGFNSPYISGAINTAKIYPKGFYCGYFELNCKLPRGPGMWTAFWLNYRPFPWTPEFDIMEQIGTKPTVTTGMLHFDPDGEGNKTQHVKVTKTDTGVDLTQDFHTYGGLWTPDYSACYFDGQLIGVARAGRRQGIGFYNAYNPMDIRINFALGTGMDDPPVQPEQLPQSFHLDWFRYSVLGQQ